MNLLMLLGLSRPKLVFLLFSYLSASFRRFFLRSAFVLFLWALLSEIYVFVSMEKKR